MMKLAAAGVKRRLICATPPPVIDAYRRFIGTPRVLRNWPIWGVRRAVAPYWLMPFWALSSNGAKFYLGSDPVDDWILDHVLHSHIDLYFPRLSSLPENDAWILDVGAHHGFVAVELLRRFPQARLIAVEPDPASFHMLRKNVIANRMLDRAELVNAAIDNSESTAILRVGSDGSWGASTIPSEMTSAQSVTVQTVPIGRILRGREPVFLKCNAEGAEYVLIPQLLAMGVKPDIIVLMAHTEFGSVPHLLQLLRKEGYIINELNTGGTESPHFHCLLPRFADSYE